MAYSIVITTYDAKNRIIGMAYGDVTEFPDDERLEGLVSLVHADAQYAYVTVHPQDGDRVLYSVIFEVHDATT